RHRRAGAGQELPPGAGHHHDGDPQRRQYSRGLGLVSYTIGAAVPWPVPPDWSDPVRETLGWLTDVLRPRNGKEPQRRKLRTSPRRSFQFAVLASAAERRLVDAVRF